MALTVVQALPAMEVGGVERGTLEIAAGLVRKGHRSIVISDNGRLVKQLLSQGSEHINWPIGKKSLSTLRYVKPLRNMLISNSVDILHVRSRLPAWISYFAWKKMNESSRPRFISTVHGPYSVNAYSEIMTKSEKVIVISKFIKDYVMNNYKDINETKLTTIYRGVDTEEFPYNYIANKTWLEKWNDEHPYLKHKFILTLPARITRWKGQEDFLNIVDGLRAEGLPICGLIAGGPHPKRTQFFIELKKQVKAKKLTEHVKFIGHRDDLKEVMSISDIVLSLAKEPEAFGRTALEALSLGIPVVAYDHGGASEVLSSLFPEGLAKANDINSVIKKIKSLYQTKPVISNNNPFTLQSMVHKTIELYEKSAAEKLK